MAMDASLFLLGVVSVREIVSLPVITTIGDVASPRPIGVRGAIIVGFWQNGINTPSIFKEMKNTFAVKNKLVGIRSSARPSFGWEE